MAPKKSGLFAIPQILLLPTFSLSNNAVKHVDLVGVRRQGKPEMLRQTMAPMNFFPIPENPNTDSAPKNPPAGSLKSMDLFPQSADSSTKMLDAAEEPKTAQMTIFYAGQVIVFNDFPADKAKEVMLLATKGSNSQVFTPQPAFVAPRIPKNQIESKARVPPSPIMSSNPIQDLLQQTAEPMASDLPIARRKSLHRFLEKRKDRITSKSPYQVVDTSAASSPDKNKAWLSLAASQ
ncbi:hypothetical protein CRG98_036114 [Punica granatum]|uniref:Protein TIFY n=1 Tax=Punica granatum TaxID=22663 RepID=A0A2I0IHM5_PUNGR|nr:hypothetical protein CRG98_036114 [Punica granatum]